jgi:hypothetical protein
MIHIIQEGHSMAIQSPDGKYKAVVTFDGLNFHLARIKVTEKEKEKEAVK